MNSLVAHSDASSSSLPEDCCDVKLLSFSDVMAVRWTATYVNRKMRAILRGRAC